jgi:hypothetical protein
VDELIGDLLSELEAARAQQSGEGRVAIPRDVAEAHGMYLIGYSWLKHNAPNEINLPADKPEGEWIRCSERLPKLGQRVQLFSQGVIQHMMPLFDDSDEGLFLDFEVYDYNPPVDFSQDQWKPLPAAPDMGGRSE